jgi:tetrahydromethanopterin S-methyltransferase subunit G
MIESKILFNGINDIVADVESRMPVDRSDLETECERQASFHEEVGDMYALSRAEVRSAEKRLKEVKAELSGKVRANPSVYGFEKITEAAVESAILLQPEYKTALELMNRWEAISDRLQNLVASVYQRKSMISDLVSLYCSNYYATGADIQGNAQERMEKIKQLRLQKANENNG